LAQLKRTTNGGFRISEEDQCHAIAGGQANELIVTLCPDELRGFAHRILQIAQAPLLLIHGQHGIRNDIHEKDMGYFEGCAGRSATIGHRTGLLCGVVRFLQVA
jgi:hypothetical protein